MTMTISKQAERMIMSATANIRRPRGVGVAVAGNSLLEELGHPMCVVVDAAHPRLQAAAKRVFDRLIRRLGDGRVRLGRNGGHYQRRNGQWRKV